MTILLPHVMRYNLERCKESYAALLPWLVGMDAAMATPAEKRAAAAIEAVEALARRLNQACGLPLTLREAGVSRDSFAKVAEFAVNDGALIVNPRAADEQQVIEILNAAY
jgi:alcohol dehydrogenase